MQAAEKWHLKKKQSFENILAGSSPKELIQNCIASVEISNFDKLVNADEELFHPTFLTISITQPVIDLDFSCCKFCAKQPASAEPALLPRNKSAGLQTIRKGIPAAGDLA